MKILLLNLLFIYFLCCCHLFGSEKSIIIINNDYENIETNTFFGTQDFVFNIGYTEDKIDLDLFKKNKNKNIIYDKADKIKLNQALALGFIGIGLTGLFTAGMVTCLFLAVVFAVSSLFNNTMAGLIATALAFTSLGILSLIVFIFVPFIICGFSTAYKIKKKYKTGIKNNNTQFLENCSHKQDFAFTIQL